MTRFLMKISILSFSTARLQEVIASQRSYNMIRSQLREHNKSKSQIEMRPRIINFVETLTINDTSAKYLKEPSIRVPWENLYIKHRLPWIGDQ